VVFPQLKKKGSEIMGSGMSDWSNDIFEYTNPNTGKTNYIKLNTNGNIGVRDLENIGVIKNTTKSVDYGWGMFNRIARNIYGD